jgi:hypothetical protein
MGGRNIISPPAPSCRRCLPPHQTAPEIQVGRTNLKMNTIITSIKLISVPIAFVVAIISGLWGEFVGMLIMFVVWTVYRQEINN